MKRKIIVLTAFSIIAFFALFISISYTQAETFQQTNILQNPGFEDPFTNGAYANNWSPWHRDTGKLDCNSSAYAVRPSWWRETNKDGNFVLDGFVSQGIGNQFDTWDGGVMQTVNVTPGQTYRFTFQARIRASNEQVPTPSDSGVGRVRAGIDPNGSGLWLDSDVVWGNAISPVDTWQQATVEATATGSQMTVFTRVDFSGANNCRAHLDSWLDQSQLIAVSTVPNNTPAPGTTPGNTPIPTTGSAPPVIVVTLGPTPTPDAEGYIRVAVPPGGSLWSVAANAGISLDELLALNNLTAGSVVSPGQLLIIAKVEPQAPATFTPAPTATTFGDVGGNGDGSDTGSGSEATSFPSATPLPTNTPVPVVTGGSICVNAFSDTNADGLHQQTEGFMAGVTFNLSQNGSVIEQGFSNGTDTSICFENLDAGSYLIQELLPSSLEPTTATELPLDITEGQQVGLEFGSRIRTETEAPAATAIADASTTTTNTVTATPIANPSDTDNDGVLGGYGGIAILGLGVLLLIVLVVAARR